MKLQAAVQEGLVSLLCYNMEYGAQVATICEPRDFDPIYRQLADLALDYRNKHKQPPGEHTLDLVDQAKEQDASHSIHYDRLFESIEQVEVNPPFLVERAAAFVRYQRLKLGIERSLKDLMRGDEAGVEAAEATLIASIKDTAPTFHAGIDFARDLEASTRFMRLEDQSLPTGIPEFDKRGLGPALGRLHLLMAQSSKGKSWWLVHLAAEAWKHGIPVLYVTLELNEDEVTQRMVQRFLSMSKRSLDSVHWEEFTESDDPDDAGLRRKTRTLKNRPSFEDARAELLVRKKLRQLSDQGRLMIRDFPQGSLSVQQLDDFLTVLSERENFLPQLVLVDYADIMKLPHGRDRWEGIIEVGEGLRRIAQTRHIAVASVSQVNFSGIKAKKVDVEHTSGAIGKIATADTVLTYSQTEEEEKHGLARLLVAKARTEEGRFSVLISQNYGIGQFVMSSTRMGFNYSLGSGD
jgi:hypothetical protein